MSRRRKRRPRTKLLCFVFTAATIDATKRALQRFECSLQQANPQNQKVAFAEETLQQVKSKLATIQQSASFTTFDYNERLLLTAAIRMYLVDLALTPQTAENARALAACQELLASFRGDEEKM